MHYCYHELLCFLPQIYYCIYSVFCVWYFKQTESTDYNVILVLQIKRRDHNKTNNYTESENTDVPVVVYLHAYSLNAVNIYDSVCHCLIRL